MQALVEWICDHYAIPRNVRPRVYYPCEPHCIKLNPYNCMLLACYSHWNNGISIRAGTGPQAWIIAHETGHFIAHYISKADPFGDSRLNESDCEGFAQAMERWARDGFSGNPPRIYAVPAHQISPGTITYSQLKLRPWF